MTDMEMHFCNVNAELPLSTLTPVSAIESRGIYSSGHLLGQIRGSALPAQSDRGSHQVGTAGKKMQPMREPLKLWTAISWGKRHDL